MKTISTVILKYKNIFSMGCIVKSSLVKFYINIFVDRNNIMAAIPRCHTDDEDDNKKVYPTKKVLFVDSYGVKSFPYRGRRKHFSSIQQILGSSTERHNDLFGMAIFQFEQKYKACLERRKQNEPQILNIIFPIKTDNRYLEYLENTQSQQTGKYNFIISNIQLVIN